MKKFFALALLTFVTACSPASQGGDQAASSSEASSMMAQSSSEDRLNDSPRHHEWVEVQNGDRTVYTWVVYPERSDAAPAVLVIHENRGLNDWARSFADEVAEAGYIAVAPDLLSGFSDEYDRTSDFPDSDMARDAIYELDAEQVQSDLEAVAAYAENMDASDGQLAAAGFCWGGAQSFEFATRSDRPEIAMVFYGTSPEQSQAYADIDMPVYGFYGGDDERVNSTIDRAEDAMSESGKDFTYEIYEGAGHAFMRNGADPSADEGDKEARTAAWNRFMTIMEDLDSSDEAAAESESASDDDM